MDFVVQGLINHWPSASSPPAPPPRWPAPRQVSRVLMPGQCPTAREPPCSFGRLGASKTSRRLARRVHSDESAGQGGFRGSSMHLDRGAIVCVLKVIFLPTIGPRLDCPRRNSTTPSQVGSAKAATRSPTVWAPARGRESAAAHTASACVSRTAPRGQSSSIMTSTCSPATRSATFSGTMKIMLQQTGRRQASPARADLTYAGAARVARRWPGRSSAAPPRTQPRCQRGGATGRFSGVRAHQPTKRWKRRPKNTGND